MGCKGMRWALAKVGSWRGFVGSLCLASFGTAQNGATPNGNELGKLTCHVVDECDEPVPRVKVTVVDDLDTLVAATLADGAGTARLTGLPLNRETSYVRLEAPGFATQEERVLLRWFDREACVRTRLRHAGTVRGVVMLRAERSATIRGRVLAAEGNGLAGAPVELVVPERNGDNTVWSAITDDDGTFCFPRHHADTRSLQVCLGPRDGTTVRSDEFRVRSGEDKVLELRAPAPLRHEGMVVDGQGRPLAGIGIELRGDGRPPRLLHSGPDGRFVVRTIGWASEPQAVPADDTETAAVQCTKGDGTRTWSIRLDRR